LETDEKRILKIKYIFVILQKKKEYFMKIYHGGYMAVEMPKILKSKFIFY